MRGDRLSSSLESLLEVLSCDYRDWVLDTFHVLVLSLAILGSQSTTILFGGDALSDSSLGSSLTKLRDICTCEILGQLSTEVEGDIGCDWGLSQVGLEDVNTGCLIGKRNVDQLI
jgi:hypothetical protein